MTKTMSKPTQSGFFHLYQDTTSLESFIVFGKILYCNVDNKTGEREEGGRQAREKEVCVERKGEGE